MAGSAGITGRHDFAGRDDRLANEIVNRLRNIERTNRGNYDELVAQMTAARYSAVPARIKKMNYLQLLSLDSLIKGYQSRVQADNKGPIVTAWRPELSGAGAVVTVPQTMSMKSANGQIYRIIAGLNGGNLIANAFHPLNVSGLPTDTETLIATPAGLEIGGGAAVRPYFAKQNDETLLFWDSDLNNDANLYRTTITAAGLFTAPAVVMAMTPTSATHTDRAIAEPFCDGRNLWWIEYDDGATTLTVKKINLVDLVQTSQVVNNVDLGSATSNGFLWANGDFCLLICEGSAGAVTRYVAFELADGAAPAAINFTTAGVLLQSAVPTRLLGGFGGTVYTAGGPRYRGFFTANAAGANGEAIHVIDFDPTAIDNGGLMADVVTNTVGIFGQTFPWGAIGFNGRHGVSADGSRLVLASTITVLNVDAPTGDTNTFTYGKMLTFALEEPRQLMVMHGIDREITALDAVSGVNADGANTLLLATIATGQHMVELSA